VLKNCKTTVAGNFTVDLIHIGYNSFKQIVDPIKVANAADCFDYCPNLSREVPRNRLGQISIG